MRQKPDYRIPSMEEIAAVPLTGYRAASLFSGCGGSSLGYRMAGFKVVWANEFISAARDTYRANFPETELDPRDIRAILPEQVLDAAGVAAGELDVLDGSPPCASFSMAGKRARDWGRVKAYSETRQRTDDLFGEYIRLLAGIRPRVFVAENVSGLIKGVAKGQFLDFLAAFKAAGYRTGARLLDAQWLGVPQMRQRLIFVGVRDDLDIEPAFPPPLSYRYSVRDALPWLTRMQHGNKAPFDNKGAPVSIETVMGGDTLGLAPWQFEIEGANGFDGHAGRSTGKPAATIQASRAVLIKTRKSVRSAGDPSPTIMTHNNRYTHSEIAIEAETDMRRYAVGRELDKLGEGEQSKRYFNLTRAALAEPSPTITVEGKKAHAASVAHPVECRKFSIAELRRICGFPDDFVLTGTYVQQWERLGRAVPPPMMAAIATAIRDRILEPLDRSAAA